MDDSLNDFFNEIKEEEKKVESEIQTNGENSSHPPKPQKMMDNLRKRNRGLSLDLHNE